MSVAFDLTRAFSHADYQPKGWREDYFTNPYGHRLRYAHAPTTAPVKRGTVVLTHGYGEFIDLYYLAIQEYQAMGFDVWAMDFYGFGKSKPDAASRSIARGVLRHVRDMDVFVRDVVKHDGQTPLILNTHSMGGLIGLLYLQKHRGVFNAAVMSSPLFDIFRFNLPRIFRPLFRGMFAFATAVGFGDKPVPATPALWDKISRVNSALTELGHGRSSLRETFNHMMRLNTPDALVERPTIGWITAVFNTAIRATSDEALAKVDVPVLIGSAGIENLVDTGEHERVAHKLKNATLVRLPTAEHGGFWFADDENYNQWTSHIASFTDKVSADYAAARTPGTAADQAPAEPPVPADLLPHRPGGASALQPA